KLKNLKFLFPVLMGFFHIQLNLLNQLLRVPKLSFWTQELKELHLNDFTIKFFIQTKYETFNPRFSMGIFEGRIQTHIGDSFVFYTTTNNLGDIDSKTQWQTFRSRDIGCWKTK